MRLIGFVVALFLCVSIPVSASTIRDAKILEASENIKYITQKIAKDYIYMYIYPNKKELKRDILDSIKKMEKNIQTIAANTKDEKIKYILDFFAYEKEQIKIVISNKQTKSNANAVLDFSEAVTEGAESIAGSIQYEFSFEESMFMRSKDINYLTERLAKYYMVLKSDIDNATIKDKLAETIQNTNDNIAKIEQYTYPGELNSKKENMIKLWRSNRYFYEKGNTLKVPSIIMLATEGVQTLAAELSIHHSRGE